MLSKPTAAWPDRSDWQGTTVAVLASGPSLCAADAEALRGRVRVVVVNATFRLAPWAQVLYAADYRFWLAYQPMLEQYQGERWTCSRLAHRRLGAHLVDRAGLNSGHNAIHLVASWGARRILLLGFDMQATGGEEHWHGAHLGKLSGPVGFPEWIRELGVLAATLAARGVKVVNCSRQTALRCWPRSTIEEELWT